MRSSCDQRYWSRPSTYRVIRSQRSRMSSKCTRTSRDILNLTQDVLFEDRLKRSNAHEIDRHPDDPFQEPLEAHSCGRWGE